MNDAARDSVTDALTGLPGYDAFMASLPVAKSGKKADGSCYSLALIDVDAFGAFNDAVGRDAGDEALRSIAEALCAGVSDGCPAFRFGGDAFMIHFPDVEKEQAFLKVEVLRVELVKMLSSKGDGLTVSVGVASYPDDAMTGPLVIRKCHEALYRAKVSGRNKVCLAREEKMVTKTTHYTQGQLEGLSRLAKREGVNEAALLREGLDDLLRKYNS